MSLKVVSTSPTFGYYATEPLEYLKTHGAQIVLAPQGEKMSEAELIEFVRDYDAIIVGIEKITAPVIEASKKLKIITKHGAGVDNVDVKAASARGIVVTPRRAQTAMPSPTLPWVSSCRWPERFPLPTSIKRENGPVWLEFR